MLIFTRCGIKFKEEQKATIFKPKSKSACKVCRINELARAIAEHARAGQAVDPTWVEEYNLLVK